MIALSSSKQKDPNPNKKDIFDMASYYSRFPGYCDRFPNPKHDSSIHQQERPTPPQTGPRFNDQIPPQTGPRFNNQMPPQTDPRFNNQRPPLAGPRFNDQMPPLAGPRFNNQMPPQTDPRFNNQMPPQTDPRFNDQMPPLAGPRFNNQMPPQTPVSFEDQGPNPFSFDIREATIRNENFRKTAWTGEYLQVTLMSIEPDSDIGFEVHDDHDQFIRIEQGQGLVVMGDSMDDLDYEEGAHEGYAIIIPAGKWHNLINTGNNSLKLYSIYAPPEHPYGSIQETRGQDMEIEEE